MMEKMIALQQKRRSKKGGFTLVELIVSPGHPGDPGSSADPGADRLYRPCKGKERNR